MKETKTEKQGNKSTPICPARPVSTSRNNLKGSLNTSWNTGGKVTS